MGPSLTVLTLFVPLFLGFASMTQSDEDSKCEETLNSESLNPGTSKDYEERKYKPSTWICTAVKKSFYVDFAVVAANNRLQSFKDQAATTDDKMRCDTWPVLIIDKKISEEYEMCWLVPLKANVASLKPSNEVEMKNVPELTVFVRKFGGTPSLDKGEENADILKKDLFNAGQSYDDSIYYGAGYDPYLNKTHHNEIWIPKKNK